MSSFYTVLQATHERVTELAFYEPISSAADLERPISSAMTA